MVHIGNSDDNGNGDDNRDGNSDDDGDDYGGINYTAKLCT
jgi:hypothetical protein